MLIINKSVVVAFGHIITNFCVFFLQSLGVGSI